MKGEHACASANGGAELLQPLHYEESCRYQTAHVGEQWEVAEASKVSEATCIIYADADGTEEQEQHNMFIHITLRLQLSCNDILTSLTDTQSSS